MYIVYCTMYIYTHELNCTCNFIAVILALFTIIYIVYFHLVAPTRYNYVCVIKKQQSIITGVITVIQYGVKVWVLNGLILFITVILYGGIIVMSF